jgi:cytosine/adenosine deaminase-related metal-dependent hydrolase
MGIIDPLDGPRFILEGRIVTMNDAFEVINRGRLYIDKSVIRGVAAADEPAPAGFDGARVVRTRGTIFPGLIELHNHLSYNVLPLWRVPKEFGNNGAWKDHAEKKRLVTQPMQILAGLADTIPAVVRYVEAKCLIAGVTTSQGITLQSAPGIRRHYRGSVRNVEQTGDPGLPPVDTRVADVEDAAAFRKRLLKGKPILLHLAEGKDERARGHFLRLHLGGDRWAISKALVGIHSAALQGNDFDAMAANGGSIVWSPLSNLLLYRHTTDVKRAKAAGIDIALGSDWSPTGSKNLLGELKLARAYSEVAGGLFTDRELVSMVTRTPARMIGWQAGLGSIDVGKRADLLVIDGTTGDPYLKLIRCSEEDVRLVVVNGVARFGLSSLVEPIGPAVERIKIGGQPRVLEFDQTTADEIVAKISLGDARDRLADALRRLPDLGMALANPILAATMLGVRDSVTPAVYTLELDEEPQSRAALRPLANLQATVDASEGSLAQALTSIVLDPLTASDDPGYLRSIADQPNLRPRDAADEIGKTLEKMVDRFLVLNGTKRAEVLSGRATPSLVSHLDPHGTAAAPLSAIYELPSTLTLADRREIIRQARTLLDDVYVHLPHKHAAYAIDPVQLLRVFEHRLTTVTPQTLGSDLEFHRDMQRLFTSLRDLHTSYLLPTPFREHTAYLPFIIERCYEGEAGPAVYLVTKVANSFNHPTLTPGAEVLYWNGVPIERAIQALAEQQAGSNPEARVARALSTLTLRPLVRVLPPDEEWVVLTYRSIDGRTLEHREPWRVFAAGRGEPTGILDSESLVGASLAGLDTQTDAVNLARRDVYAPAAAAAARRVRAMRTQRPVKLVGTVDTTMPTVFRSFPVVTQKGMFAYVRIFTFNVPSASEFVSEFLRLIEVLPQEGLILDVRNNAGGLITAAEQLLQLLTPRNIEPQRAQFVSTPWTLELCRRHQPSPFDPSFTLAPWVDSLALAATIGATYSNGATITDVEEANAIGQRYGGPVLLITDALCYSATDMFAAGFRDHDIGPILGVDGNTGAGGANVWRHGLIQRLLEAKPSPFASESVANPYRALPGGVDITVAVRRTLRGGLASGMPVEDLGIRPDAIHRTTRRDVLEGNQDLLEHAGRLLASRPRYRLDVSAVERKSSSVKIDLATANLVRVDAVIAQRVVATMNASRGVGSLRASVNKDATQLRLQGYAKNDLLAVSRILPLPRGVQIKRRALRVKVQRVASGRRSSARIAPRRLRT